VVLFATAACSFGGFLVCGFSRSSKELYMLPNARVQLRAVGPMGVKLAAISISVQDFNRNDFLRSRARRLQRMLAGRS